MQCIDEGFEVDACNAEGRQFLRLSQCIEDDCIEPDPLSCEQPCERIGQRLFRGCSATLESESMCRYVARHIEAHCQHACEGEACCCDHDCDDEDTDSDSDTDTDEDKGHCKEPAGGHDKYECDDFER